MDHRVRYEVRMAEFHGGGRRGSSATRKGAEQIARRATRYYCRCNGCAYIVPVITIDKAEYDRLHADVADLEVEAYDPEIVDLKGEIGTLQVVACTEAPHQWEALREAAGQAASLLNRFIEELGEDAFADVTELLDEMGSTIDRIRRDLG